jgi:hypothetical protein
VSAVKRDPQLLVKGHINKKTPKHTKFFVQVPAGSGKCERGRPPAARRGRRGGQGQRTVRRQRRDRRFSVRLRSRDRRFPARLPAEFRL